MINLQKAEFLRSAAAERDFPSAGTRQIVFAGRSNVGKSSVINLIVNRKNLARTGQKPGKTVNVNLYGIDSRLVFADLPGYGYAKVSREEKERWGTLLSAYFGRCGGDIALGILVFDIRRDPNEDDFEMVRLFSSLGIPYIVCANKADKLTKTELAAAPARLASAFGIEESALFVLSAVAGTGRAELVRRILDAAE